MPHLKTSCVGGLAEWGGVEGAGGGFQWGCQKGLQYGHPEEPKGGEGTSWVKILHSHDYLGAKT